MHPTPSFPALGARGGGPAAASTSPRAPAPGPRMGSHPGAARMDVENRVRQKHADGGRTSNPVLKGSHVMAHLEAENSPVQFSPIEVAVEEIKAGRIIVVVDDEDRENEGDLVMAAERVSPEAVNFMTKYGRGLICVPMSGD